MSTLFGACDTEPRGAAESRRTAASLSTRPLPGEPVRRLASLLVLTVATLVAVTPVKAVSSAPSTPQPGTPYTVLQMNLCLSGTADCYARTAYPAIVQ